MRNERRRGGARGRSRNLIFFSFGWFFGGSKMREVLFFSLSLSHLISFFGFSFFFVLTCLPDEVRLIKSFFKKKRADDELRLDAKKKRWVV